MKELKGITASSGLVKGVACVYSEKATEAVPHYAIEQHRVKGELSRLTEAFAKAKETMKQMIQASEKMPDKRASEIFNAHLMVLEDPVLHEKMVALIKNRLINAEHAANDAFEEYIDAYETKELHFAELAHDIMDVRNRLLASFGDASGHFECPEGERKAVVVVSKRLTPSMVLHIPRQHVLAFVTEEGGLTTHATILARSYNVPVVFGIEVEHMINCGDRVIVDGSHGKVIVAPDTATDKQYKQKIADIEKKKKVCEVKRSEPSLTKKGLRVQLKINISTPGELELAKDLHYDGIGLLRTEFLFLNKDVPPTEDEQFTMYRTIVEEAGGRHVVIRLLDIGADKMPGYLHLPVQDNPDLGIRGARALDFFYDVYLTQIRAILRASAFGDVRLLYPMVADLGDIGSFRSVTNKAKAALRREKKKFKHSLQEGIMVETPAAAIMAQTLLAAVDFASIGSNDLLQYTLAAGRGNLAIEKRYHILHPALVQLIEFVVKAGRYHGKEVCLCGEIASFENFYPLLLGLGLRSFSVAASKLADIKCELLHQTKSDKSLVQKFYKTTAKEDTDKFFIKNS
jgi:phosphotransferase system enzyme I (PtsI)